MLYGDQGPIAGNMRKVIAEHLSDLIDATGLRHGAREIYLYTLLVVVLLLTLCLPRNLYVDCFTSPVVSVPDGNTVERLHGNNPERICLNEIGLSAKEPSLRHVS